MITKINSYNFLKKLACISILVIYSIKLPLFLLHYAEPCSFDVKSCSETKVFLFYISFLFLLLQILFCEIKTFHLYLGRKPEVFIMVLPCFGSFSFVVICFISFPLNRIVAALVHLDSYNRIPFSGSLTDIRYLFLTILKARKSYIKVSADFNFQGLSQLGMHLTLSSDK